MVMSKHAMAIHIYQVDTGFVGCVFLYFFSARELEEGITGLRRDKQHTRNGNGRFRTKRRELLKLGVVVIEAGRQLLDGRAERI